MRHVYREKNGRYYVRIQVPKSFKHSHLVPKSREIRLSLYSSTPAHATELGKAYWLAARHVFRTPDLVSLNIKTLADLKNHIRASVVTHLPQKYVNLIELTSSADKHHLQAAIKLALAYNLSFYLIPPLTYCEEFRRVQNERSPYGKLQHIAKHTHGKQFPHSLIDSTLLTQAMNDNAEDFSVEWMYYNSADGELRMLNFPRFPVYLHQLFVSTDLPAHLIATIRRLTDTRTATSIITSTTPPKSVLLAQEIDNYREFKADKWTDKTKDEFKMHLDVFLQMVGKDKEVLQLTNDDYDFYLKNLPRLPKNRTKNPLYRGKSIQEILAMPDQPEPISPRTVDQYYGTVFGFMEYAIPRNEGMKSGLLTMKPQTNSRKKRSKKREAFKQEHLSLMFESQKSLDFLATARHPYQIWLGPLALHTGARIDELCAMTIDAIGIKDGIHYYDLNNEDDDTRLGKTENAVRRIPMHPTLAALGLPKFAAWMRDRPKEMTDGRLFPECTWVHKHGYKKAASRWFNETFFEFLGISDPKYVFHSFRRNVSNLLNRDRTLLKWTINRYFGHGVAQEESESVRHYLDESTLDDFLPILNAINYKIDWTKYAELCRNTYK